MRPIWCIFFVLLCLSRSMIQKADGLPTEADDNGDGGGGDEGTVSPARDEDGDGSVVAGIGDGTTDAVGDDADADRNKNIDRRTEGGTYRVSHQF